MLHIDVTLLGWLYAYPISHFTDISRVFLQNTSQNTKHSLYTFPVSFKFVSVRKLTTKSFWHFTRMPPWRKMTQNAKKVPQNTPLYTVCFSYFRAFHSICKKCIAGLTVTVYSSTLVSDGVTSQCCVTLQCYVTCLYPPSERVRSKILGRARIEWS